jgi:hypothetical protein
MHVVSGVHNIVETIRELASGALDTSHNLGRPRSIDVKSIALIDGFARCIA